MMNIIRKDIFVKQYPFVPVTVASILPARVYDEKQPGTQPTASILPAELKSKKVINHQMISVYPAEDQFIGLSYSGTLFAYI